MLNINEGISILCENRSTLFGVIQVRGEPGVCVFGQWGGRIIGLSLDAFRTQNGRISPGVERFPSPLRDSHGDIAAIVPGYYYFALQVCHEDSRARHSLVLVLVLWPDAAPLAAAIFSVPPPKGKATEVRAALSPTMRRIVQDSQDYF